MNSMELATILLKWELGLRPLVDQDHSRIVDKIVDLIADRLGHTGAARRDFVVSLTEKVDALAWQMRNAPKSLPNRGHGILKVSDRRYVVIRHNDEEAGNVRVYSDGLLGLEGNMMQISNYVIVSQKLNREEVMKLYTYLIMEAPIPPYMAKWLI